MADATTLHILLAGGGTGGHIFPNLAIAQATRRLAASTDRQVQIHFLISDRPLDEQILQEAELPFTALGAAPWRARPVSLVKFALGYAQAKRTVIQQLKALPQSEQVVLVATGGFVSAPCITAVRNMRGRTALLNLDATAGKANRVSARQCDKVFTCYASAKLPGGRETGQDRDEAEVVGLPVRQAARATHDSAEAREQLGLSPDMNTLLVTAGSQGAVTLNQMMRSLITGPRGQTALAGWQVLHLCGPGMQQALQAGYNTARVPAVVLPFLNEMGLAWSAATLAISRAGASSVGEVWHNAVPTLFFPYPFHADQHQKLNTKPLTDRGAAVVFDDLKDSTHNVHQLLPTLEQLAQNDVRRERMRQLMRQSRPEDGAARIARWALNGQ